MQRTDRQPSSLRPSRPGIITSLQYRRSGGFTLGTQNLLETFHMALEHCRTIHLDTPHISYLRQSATLPTRFRKVRTYLVSPKLFRISHDSFLIASPRFQ